MGGGRGGDFCTVGAEFLAAAGGAGCCYYFEVEVLEAKGLLAVGFAGTNLGPQCPFVGGDACSWSCGWEGSKLHRCVWTRGRPPAVWA